VIAPELPEWSKEVPFQIKKIAVRDAIFALKTNKKKVKQGIIKKFELSFRKRKNATQSCFIVNTAIKKNGIYVRISGKGLRYAESLPETIKDSRLIWRAGKFYLAVPTTRKLSSTDNQGGKVVSIDPGMRSFHTFYSGDYVGHIGQGDFSRIQRMASHLDNLISRASKAPKKRKKRMLLAVSRMR